MKEFDDIVTDLPYKESPGEVEQLVSRCKEAALAKAKPAGRIALRPWFYGVASVAVAAAVAIGIFLWPSRSSSLSSSPIESFLASLSDDEAAMIVDWPVDDIPELY